MTCSSIKRRWCWTSTGRESTRCGPRLYPHQWSWDAALISIGYSHYDQHRAESALTHLFEAQWKNGLLPQIVFNPAINHYFPGPNFWHAKESPDYPKDSQTSGVVMPPVHATAVLCIYRNAEDQEGAKKFLEYIFPRLEAWHEYLYRERDPADVGLVYIRHPWESGMDNSPMWDQIWQRLRSELTRYRATSVRIPIPPPLRLVRPAPPTTASPTWSNSSPTAPTTKRR